MSRSQKTFWRKWARELRRMNDKDIGKPHHKPEWWIVKTLRWCRKR